MHRTRIILVDDHRILLDAIKALIEPEFEVVGMFDEAQALLDNAAQLRPDIVVLDVGMPMMNGLSAGEHLRKILPRTKVIYLTMNHDLDTAAHAFQLGASGYVVKSATGTDLVKAIREVMRGGYYASPILTEGMVGSFVRAFKQMKGPHSLTLRQKEVLQLLAEGLSMKEIAQALNITPRTVAFHKYTMMRELNITSNAALMKYADSQRLSA